MDKTKTMKEELAQRVAKAMMDYLAYDVWKALEAEIAREFAAVDGEDARVLFSKEGGPVAAVSFVGCDAIALFPIVIPAVELPTDKENTDQVDAARAQIAAAWKFAIQVVEVAKNAERGLDEMLGLKPFSTMT